MVQRCVRGDYLIILYNFHMKAVSKSTVLFHFDSRLMVSSVSKLVGFQIWRCYCVLLAGMVSPDKKSGIAVDKVGFIWVHSFDVHWYIHFIYIYYIYVYMYIYILIFSRYVRQTWFTICRNLDNSGTMLADSWAESLRISGRDIHTMAPYGSIHLQLHFFGFHAHCIQCPRGDWCRLQMASPDFVHLFSSLAGMMTPPGLHILHEGPVT